MNAEFVEELYEAGLDPNRMRKVQFELDYLRQNGLLLTLNITGGTMFTRTANFAELGIGLDEDDKRFERYTPGRKYIISSHFIEQINSVITRMRVLYSDSTQAVTGFYPYRWLAWPMYPNFKREWERLNGEFIAVKTRILECYNQEVNLLAEDYAEVARKTWEAATRKGYGGIILRDRKGGDRRITFVNLDAFTDWVVSRALELMPRREQIIAKLNADYRPALLDSEFAQVSREEAQEQLAAAEARAQAARLEVQRVKENLENDRRQHSLEEQERQQRIAEKEIAIIAMRQAELEHARAQVQEIGSPFEEVFSGLRQKIADDCEEIRKSIVKNGYVVGKVAERARGLVELFDLMAAHSDEELRAKLTELRAQIGAIGNERTTSTPKRDTEQVTQTLTEIVNMAAVEGGRLARATRAAFVEVVNDTGDMVD